MALSREEIEEIAKRTADEVTSRLNEDNPSKCKECVTWSLVGMAATEALEHNAIVGGALREVGKTIKGMVSKDEWEDLVGELDWFERPITEMTADIAVHGALNELEKCGLDVSKARRLHQEGSKANEKGESSSARFRYIDLKNELISLAGKLTCLNGQDD